LKLIRVATPRRRRPPQVWRLLRGRVLRIGGYRGRMEGFQGEERRSDVRHHAEVGGV